MSAPTMLPYNGPLDGGALSPRGSRSSRAWIPLAVAFVGYPVLWTTGLGLLAYPLAGLIAFAGLLRRDAGRGPLPMQVTAWFAFLAWTLTSLLVLRSADRLFAWGYRSVMYLSGTALLLWVLRASRERLSDRVALQLVSGLWIATVIGGFLALVIPGVEITTIVERLLPSRLLQIGLIEQSVHLQIADEARFLSFPVGRPEAPYAFTNGWGSNLVLLTPLVFATWALDSSRRWRRWTMALAAFSVIPLIVSLNRGAWLSLLVGMLYGAVRSVRRLDRRRVAQLLAVAVIGVAVLVTSPLGEIVQARTENGHSDQGRANLYSQAIDLTIRSPIVGWGAPQPNQLKPGGPSIGTHGQLWLLLVSNGIPAAALYITFFALAFLAAFRWRAPQAIWLEMTLVIALVQFPVYELLPDPMPILAVVAGLALRGHRDQQARSAR